MQILNPGFELFQSDQQPVGWSPLPAQWSIDPNISFAEQYSLRIQNQDPAWYQYPSQEIFLEAGKSYRLSVWAKGENLANEKSLSQGATFCLEYYDQQNRWLGGDYGMPTLLGTLDWQPLVLEELIVPFRWMGKEIAHQHLLLFLTKGTTGTAWFDDFTIEEINPPVLQFSLLSPNYRGHLVMGEANQVRLKITAHPEVLAMSLKEVTLSAILEKTDGEVLKSQTLSSLNKQEFEIILEAPSGLAEGTSLLLRLTLSERKTDQCFAEKAEYLTITTLNQRARFAAFVDQAKRLLCQGEPFFPLGIYTANTELPHDPNDPEKDELTQQLEALAQSPFDTLVNYNTLAPLSWVSDTFSKEECYNYIRHYLGLLQKYDLRLLCPVPSEHLFGDPNAHLFLGEIINHLKDHPTLLGWYLNDELGPVYFHKLDEYNRILRAKDPDHPTWSVLTRLADLSKMVPTTDILGVDPYPVPDAPIAYVAEACQAADQAGSRTRPFWAVIQTHDTGLGRPPTREQVRAMSYLAIIQGAGGLFYYSYFEIWEQNDKSARWEWLKLIGEEMRALRPVLLSLEEAPFPGLTCSSANVYFLLKRWQGKLYLLLTNSSETERVQVTLKGSDNLVFPAAVGDFLQEEGLVQEGSYPPPLLNNNKLVVTLAPLAVCVYDWLAQTNGSDGSSK